MTRYYPVIIEMQETDALVLEILRQEDYLVMSAFSQDELSSTLRHYSRCPASFTQVARLCQEVISVLNKAARGAGAPADLIEDLKRSGQLLWDELLASSVKDRLRQFQGKDLILSLEEELIGIPWELLYDGRDFFCLKFNLGRVVKTREKITPAQYRDFVLPLKMLILANPTNDLNSAYREGLYIKNRFDRRRNYLNIHFKSTDIDLFYLKKNLRDYDIVHFAGHCEYDADNPQNTGWLLSDGKFTAGDILKLKEALFMPRLIFSNACCSAGTGGDALADDECQQKTYSLASAFLFAGVRHYIGAVWKIEDSAGFVFSREFYSHLIKGRAIGECVRLGRLKLIAEYGISRIYWASYLLYGDPTPLFFREYQGTIKLKKYSTVYKKWLARSAVLLTVAAVFALICFYLPRLNPDCYLSYTRAQKLFLTGQNEESFLVCNRIINKNPLFLPAYPLLADIYRRRGDKENALKYYFEYAIKSQKKDDKNNLASAYIGIGWLYYQYGKYSRAYDFYNKALDLSRENKDPLNEATALRKLAVLHMDKEEYNLALELLTKSSEINRQRQHLYKHRYNLACDYFDIGLLFINRDDLAAAKEFYFKSKVLFEKMHLKNELSDYYFNLGEIYLYDKQYQKTLDCYMRGLAIDRKHDDKPNIASDYNMIGELYLEMDRPEEAEGFFNEGVLLCQSIDAPIELAGIYHNLGLLYKGRKQTDKARGYFSLAHDIYSQTDMPEYAETKQELLGLGEAE